MAKNEDGSFHHETKRIILVRSEGRCEICGLKPEAGQFHHRRPRRMGGTRSSLVAVPANGLWLHPQCHARVEINRKRSMSFGWLLTATQDPERVPVMYMGAWRLLVGSEILVPEPSDFEYANRSAEVAVAGSAGRGGEAVDPPVPAAPVVDVLPLASCDDGEVVHRPE